MVLAAAVDYSNPLFWAVLIGWILSVVLHEFAHGLVAHLGGDYTVAERGGLTLNPLQYIDPVYSLLIPGIMLLVGGVPLPGGVTYVRDDLLRSRAWSSAVSLAGPAMNLLLFLLLIVPLHPMVGWLDPWASSDQWTPAQRLIATLAVLQFISVLLNLAPVPPLDGFGAIRPFLNHETRIKLGTPPVSTVLYFAYFLLLWRSGIFQQLFALTEEVLGWLGFDDRYRVFFGRSFNSTIFGLE
jgi:Zn-dependent protease